MTNHDKEDSGHYKFERRKVRNFVDENNKNYPEIMEEFRAAYSLLEDVMMDSDMMASIQKASEIIIQSFMMGGKLIICGNGGSMCDAMHFAAEMTGRFIDDRKPFPAIAISDPAHITCVANDYGFEYIFSRAIQALLKPEDVLFLITTSGNSENIVSAHITNDCKSKVVALTGKGGGQLRANIQTTALIGKPIERPICEITVPVTNSTARIQEIHIKIIHILCKLIEKAFE